MKKIIPFALAVAPLVALAFGCHLNFIASAVQDCHRDPVAFPEACAEAAAHPTLAAFFSR